MNGMQVLRYLDWPRFLRVFGFVDVAALVIPVWALALRMNGAAEDSPALDNLRQLSLDAHQELLDLLSDAAERINQNASDPERR